MIKGADHGFSKPEHLKIAAKGALEWLTKRFPGGATPRTDSSGRP
jgi:hypothetical protein